MRYELGLRTWFLLGESPRAAGEWRVERISEVHDLPVQHGRVAQEGVANGCTFEEVAKHAGWMRQAGQVGLIHCACRDRDAALERICRPVHSTARVGGGEAVEMKSDRPDVPCEGVIV